MKSIFFRIELLALFVLPLFWLIPRVAGHITMGDASELALAGATLGIAHSPGYPVFAIVNKFFSDLIFFGNAAYRQNIVCLLFMMGSLVVIGQLLALMTGRRIAGLFALAFLVSPLFRHLCFVTEVFPLALFAASLLLLQLFHTKRHPKRLLLITFLFGIAVAVHQTLLLMAPVLLLFILLEPALDWKKRLSLLPSMVLCFVGGLSVHLYLFFRSHAGPVLDWEDPQTIGRFWNLVTRARYGFFNLAQGQESVGISWERISAAFTMFKSLLVSNIGWTGCLLLLVGSVMSLNSGVRRRWMFVMWAHILFTGPFFYWLAGANGAPVTDIFNRFGMVPLLGVGIMMGVGAVGLWESKIPLYRGFLAALLLSLALESNYRHKAEEAKRGFSSELRWDLSLHEAAMNTLRMMPPKAVLFADRADETEFSMAFVLAAENRRPELRFIDCNAGVSKSIYGDDYYGIWGPPRLRRRTKVESEIIQNSKVPVFYATVDPTMINLVRTPYGLLHHAWPLQGEPQTNSYVWDKLTSWRFLPVEPRGKNFFRVNSDMLGRELFDRGYYESAIRMFGLAQRAGSSNRFEQMGYWMHVRGRIDPALQYYDEALKRGVSSPSLINNRNAILSQRGQS